MRCAIFVCLTAGIAMGETGTASVAGAVLDAKTEKPVAGALVMAIKTDAPPFTKSMWTAGDGAFRIEGLVTGTYSLCVQVPSDQYLDPCEWDGAPVKVAVTPEKAASGVSLKLATASILKIHVKDAQKVITQANKDGREPEMSLGVWDSMGLYHPARPSAISKTESKQANGAGNYEYQLAVPRDTSLHIYAASRDLKLGDADGVELRENANRQEFRHATGDNNPKSFTFTVLGRRP